MDMNRLRELAGSPEPVAEDSSAVDALNDLLSQLHSAIDALNVSDDTKNDLASEVMHFEDAIWDIMGPEVSDHEDMQG